MTTLATLKNLESKYMRALEHVRELIKMEEPETSSGSSRIPYIPAPEPRPNATPFAALSQPDAAEVIFKENGNKALSADELMEILNSRNHPVSSVKSLYNNLSANDRFQKPERGKFNLKTQP